MVPPETDAYDGWSDKQLVTQVMTNAGAAGAGAMAELSRRHTVAMRNSSNSARWLAGAMLLLAVIQIGLIAIDIWG